MHKYTHKLGPVVAVPLTDIKIYLPREDGVLQVAVTSSKPSLASVPIP